MNSTRQAHSGNRLGHRPSAARTLLMLLAVLLTPGLPGWFGADAAAGAKLPAIVLDTTSGPYVIGGQPGRVEVLFFSFPG